MTPGVGSWVFPVLRPVMLMLHPSFDSFLRSIHFFVRPREKHAAPMFLKGPPRLIQFHSYALSSPLPTPVPCASTQSAAPQTRPCTRHSEPWAGSGSAWPCPAQPWPMQDPPLQRLGLQMEQRPRGERGQQLAAARQGWRSCRRWHQWQAPGRLATLTSWAPPRGPRCR